MSPTLSVSPKLEIDDVPLSIDENDMDESNELRSISAVDDNENDEIQENGAKILSFCVYFLL